MTSRESNRRLLLTIPLALYALIALPRLFTVGLFQDGVVFASVARNMAQGVGGFWTPRFTDTAYRLEFMHPPLGAFLQSLAFRLFGDLPRLEVAYGALLGLCNLGLLALVWRTLRSDRRDGVGAWLPLFVYVSMPIVVRSYTSNLLESPMTSFILLSILASYRALVSLRRAGSLGWGIAAGAILCCAIQTKGPPAAFVLVFPLFAGWLLPEAPWRRSLWLTGLVTVVAALASALWILPNPAAIEFTRQHYGQFLVEATLGGTIPFQGCYSVLNSLVKESAPPVFLLMVASAVTRIRPRLASEGRVPLFLAMTLAGSLPFLLTTHQYSRYVLPALAMAALALGFAWQDLGEHWETGLHGRGRKMVALTSTLMVVAGATGMILEAGTITKNVAFHRDFDQETPLLEGRPLFSVCPSELATDWVLVGDVQRYLKASLTPEPGQPFWLTESAADCQVPSGCTSLHEGTTYHLFRCADDEESDALE